MCDRWRQVAGQRKNDLALARLVGVSRSEVPGHSLANLSEPTFRKLIPVKNVATALGFTTVPKFPEDSHCLNSVRFSARMAGHQPQQSTESGRSRRFFFPRGTMIRAFEWQRPFSKTLSVVSVQEAYQLRESSNDLPGPMTLGGNYCGMLLLAGFHSLRKISRGESSGTSTTVYRRPNCAMRKRTKCVPNRVETRLRSAVRWLPEMMVLAHAPNWVLVDWRFGGRIQRSPGIVNPPAGNTPMPVKGSA